MITFQLNVAISIAKFGYCHDMSSICLSSVTREYYDETAEARICGFHTKVAKYLTYSVVNLKAKFEGVPSVGSSNYGWVVFNFIRGDISRKCDKIKL